MARKSKTPTYRDITPEQRRALADYADEHGSGWKRKLMTEWMRGSAPPELHALRNSHGPEWLEAYELLTDNPTSAGGFSEREHRFYRRMRSELGWDADDAGKAVVGQKAMVANNWEYTWRDYYDPEDGEKSNQVIVLDENGEEVGDDWEFTFSDIGQAATAGKIAYYAAKSRGRLPNPAGTDRATILAARLAQGL